MSGWVDTALLVGLITADLLMVASLFRMLRMTPAPAFARLGLRHKALEILPAAAGPSWWKLRRDQLRGHFGWLRFALYAIVLLGLVRLPLDLRVGLLGDRSDSKDFLQTSWQVVAAALGLSVAMVAFAFEAFSTTGYRAYGGSLREFATQSRLVYLIEIGVLSLLLDGVVLGGWGYNAPRGFPAALAIAFSAASLIGVAYVVHRVLRLLDDSALRGMRAERVGRLVDAAMQQQLMGQAADMWLDQSGLGVSRDYFAPSNATPLYSKREGVVTDVRIGRLARFARTHPATTLSLGVGLNSKVTPTSPVLFLRGEIGRRAARLSRAVRVKPAREEAAEAALSTALEKLHQQAMDAARTGNELEWRAISESYEQVLLALPKAAAAWGVPFSGAVMAPGLFGHGPVQRIANFLYDELVAAVDSNSRELIGPITYFPQHIATSAAELGAPSLAGPMMGLYPAMYVLAKRSGL